MVIYTQVDKGGGSTNRGAVFDGYLDKRRVWTRSKTYSKYYLHGKNKSKLLGN